MGHAILTERNDKVKFVAERERELIYIKNAGPSCRRQERERGRFAINFHSSIWEKKEYIKFSKLDITSDTLPIVSNVHVI